jgi:hypothetical protein
MESILIKVIEEIPRATFTNIFKGNYERNIENYL